ncbi:ADP-ribosylation [Auricularia subglabra TFB-10046 SS5]|nr:ADP-ribosylation [Auricularia subglabra TFB-10046 SS5]
MAPLAANVSVVDLTLSDDELEVVTVKTSLETHTQPRSRRPGCTDPSRPTGVIDLTLEDGPDENTPPQAGPSRKRRLEVVPNEPSPKKARTSLTIDEQERADAALAQRLAEEEEVAFSKLVKTIGQRKEGIVFRVVVDVRTGTLEDGTPAHPDDLQRFEPWSEHFRRTNLRVKKFTWIVNYELEKRFENARKRLTELLNEEPQEMQLFHGTPVANIPLILDGGFKIGGLKGHGVAHGTALGFGIYLAEHPSTAVGYTMGSNKLFACRVLPGRITNNFNYSNRPPLAWSEKHCDARGIGSERYETYHSPNFGGFGAGSGAFVVRHPALVLPCYMIEFDMDVQYGGATVANVPQAQWQSYSEDEDEEADEDYESEYDDYF